MTPPVKKDRKDAATLAVSDVSPADNSPNVAIDTDIQIAFGYSIASASVNSSTILVEREA